jgi:N-acetyl sugar amidotransferase
MIFCSRCLYPSNHPLNITFDERGVCSGCLVHEEKDSLDWRERGEKLGRILSEFRSKSGDNYDCIVPVSGARDSYFIVHTLKHVYGMHPLLVNYNKHYNTQRGIRNLAYLRTLFDCDCLTMTVDPARVKRITRDTLKLLGSMYWHCLAGQTVFPVRTAVHMKIPLIVWGVHQGCDQVGMFSHLDEVEMTRKYRKEHDLLGYEAEDLLECGDEITESDIEQYIYPDDINIESVGVRGIYMGNYLRWDSKAQHEEMIQKYSYETASQLRTFDCYNDVDSFHYSGLHDYIKFLKFGYGKAFDHACREIRLKRLSRSEAIELCMGYLNKEPQDRSLFIDWLGIEESSLDESLDKIRNREIWGQDESGAWRLNLDLRAEIEKFGKDEVALEVLGACNFNCNSSRTEVPEVGYRLFGRGFVDKD